jgi:hypothetical protein
VLFNRVIKMNPNVFPPWYYIGIYYLKEYAASSNARDLAKAVDSCRKLLDMVPDYGGFPIYDPERQMDLRLDAFLYLHDEVKELTIDEITAL